MIRFLGLWAAMLWLSAFVLSAQKIDMEQVRADDDFRWGVRAFHEGHFSDAIMSLEKSLSRKSAGIPPRIWLGDALYKSGFEEAALNEWKQALERDPGNSLLKSKVQQISFRRGVARDIGQKAQYVVAGEINAEKGKFYPLKRPSAVHARSDGSLYLVAFGTNEILLLDANAAVQKIISGGLKGFNRPFDSLEVEDPASGQRFLFISEYGANRIVKAGLRGDRIKEFGAVGSGPGQLLGPQYLAADGAGYLYVTDWGNARVNKYDLEGRFVLSMGGKGAVAEPLAGPTGIAVQDGRVYVADRARKKVYCFDESGNQLFTFGEGQLSSPEGLVFRDPDTLLVADANRILSYRLPTETWETASDLSGDAGKITHLSISPNDELYAVDFDRNSIFILSEMSSLYTGLSLQVERVVSNNFPEIFVDVSVQDRWGNPIVGLNQNNFLITERFAEVNEPVLVRSNTDPAPLELILLVEKSLRMSGFREELSAAAEALFKQLYGKGDLQVVSAGEKPVVEASFGSTRLAVMRAAALETWTHKWRFDRGVRLAAAQLIPRYARKAVVFLTTGELDADAFAEYSLSETSRYLANNGIAFYTVHFGPQAAEELSYISAETGGRGYNYFRPQGIDGLVKEASARVASLYTLKYRSRANPGFGRNYIDVQAEVVLHRRSGRTESGYFAPLSD